MMAFRGGGRGGNGFVCHGDKKGGQLRSVSVFVTHETTGAKITPILPTLRHPPLRASCRSVKKNTVSLVKGMILLAQGGGRGGEGGKGHGRKRSPPSVRGPLVF